MVVYHSMTGNTEKMAKAVTDGARLADGVDVDLIKASSVNVEDLEDVDGYAFGAPNTFGGMAGELRAFFDNAWKIKEKMTGKPAVAFTSENQDTNAALQDIERFFNYYKLEKAADGVVAFKTPSESDLKSCRELGRILAEKAKKTS
jgi:multimeric flavodoxin WrbA